MSLWRKYDERILPKFPPNVKKDINLLDELELETGWEYAAKDGKKYIVVMYFYPPKAVSKHGEFKGSIQTYEENGEEKVRDTRMYKTPCEGTEPNCRINYYTVQAGKRTYDTMTPSEWVKLFDWKPGDGKQEGIPLPDTTPRDIPPEYKALMENEKLKFIKAQGAKEAGVKDKDSAEE